VRMVQAKGAGYAMSTTEELEAIFRVSQTTGALHSFRDTFRCLRVCRNSTCLQGLLCPFGSVVAASCAVSM